MVDYSSNNKTALDAAYEQIERVFTKEISIPVELRHIDYRALSTWTEVWIPGDNTFYTEHGAWDWGKQNKTLKNRHKERLFDVSIWSGEQLCGLALGHLSRVETLAIEYIQGSPISTHPLKGQILNIVIMLAFEYAKLTKRKNVRIIDPIPPLINTYKTFGFQLKNIELHKSTPCCIKEVAP